MASPIPKLVIIEAKQILLTLPEAKQLPKEAFIYVCVEGGAAFMRIRKEHRRQRQLLSYNGEDNGDNGHHAHHERRDSRRNSSWNVEHEAEAHNERQVRRHSSTHKRKHHRHLSDAEMEVLTACVLSQYKYYCSTGLSSCFGDTPMDESTTSHTIGSESRNDNGVSRYTSIPAAKVEAAQIVKNVLDKPFREGLITRHQYSIIVISVLESVFMPNTFSVRSDGVKSSSNAAVLGGSRSASGGSNRRVPSEWTRGTRDTMRSTSGQSYRQTSPALVPSPSSRSPSGAVGLNSNALAVVVPSQDDLDMARSILHGNSNGSAVREDYGGDLRQDPNEPLQPAVRQKVLELAMRAVRYFEGQSYGPLGGKAHSRAWGTSPNRHGSSSHHFGEGPLDLSPHPYHPASGGSHGPHGEFDSEFEAQVDRLRQVLEQRFALDLTGTRAGTMERAATPKTEVKHLPSTGAPITSPSSPQLERDSLPHDETSRMHGENKTVRSRKGSLGSSFGVDSVHKDSLLTSARTYQEEITQLQSKLYSVVQELGSLSPTRDA